MTDIFKNPALRSKLSDVGNNVLAGQGARIIEDSARLSEGEELLLDRVSKYSIHRQDTALSVKQDAIEKVSEFVEYINKEFTKADNDFTKLLSNSWFRGQVKIWSKALKNHQMKISAEAILLKEMQASDNKEKKFCYQATRNILGSGLMEGWNKSSYSEVLDMGVRKYTDSLTNLSEYIQRLPRAELIRILKDNYIDCIVDHRLDATIPLAAFISGRDDVEKIMEGLEDFAHLDRQRERIEFIFTSFSPSFNWHDDERRAFLISRILGTLDENKISEDTLIDFAECFYVLSHGSRQGLADDRYPEKQRTREYAQYETYGKELLARFYGFPTEIKVKSLNRTIFDTRVTDPIRLLALRELYDLDMQAAKEDSKKVLDLAINLDGAVASSLVDQASKILIEEDELQPVMDAIKTELEEDGSKSKILFMTLFAPNIENRNLLIDRLLDEIPDFCEKAQSSIGMKGLFSARVQPWCGFQLSQKFIFINDRSDPGYNMISALRRVNNGGASEIYAANILDVVSLMGQGYGKEITKQAPDLASFFERAAAIASG